MRVNILGTEYTILVKKYAADEAFARNSLCGYCDGHIKQIIICDMSTYKGWEQEPEETTTAAQKETLRHEIVHAFFYESGVADNGLVFEGSWAKNEEMIDWFALQGLKIYKAWQEAGAT